MKKTGRFSVIVFALSLVFLVTISISSAPSPVTILFWDGIGPPEADVMSAFVKEFNATNKDHIKVDETLLKWDTLYTKFLTDFRTGNAPDVMTFHQPALLQYAHLGVLQEIDSLLGRAGIQGAAYVERAWRGTVIGGKRYAVPNDMHPWALYYNRALFKAAGLPDRAPATMEEFLSFAKKLTADTDNDGKIDRWGFGLDYAGGIPHRLLISLLAQKGQSVLSANGKRATLNNAKTKEALQFMYDLVYVHKVVPERETDSYGDFLRGSVAMILDGPWNLLDFKAKKDLSFGTAPIPTFYAKPAVWGSSHVFVFPKTKNKQRLEAAMKFIAFVSKKGFDWTAKAGHMPVRKDILASQEFKELKEWQAFAESTEFMVYYPAIANYSRVFSHDPASPLVRMTESVLLNKASVDNAVKLAEDEFNAILR